MCIEKPSEESKQSVNTIEQKSKIARADVKSTKLESMKLPLNENVTKDYEEVKLKSDYSSFTLPSARTRKEPTMTTSTSHPSLETNASTLLPVTGKHPLLQQPAIIDKTDR